MTVKRYEVTDDLVAAATVRDSSHCVVADAIRSARPDVQLVSVDLQTIRFTNKKTKKRYTYLTPPACQQTLIAFDQGDSIEPFGFYLGPPIHVDAAKLRPKKDGHGTERVYKPRSIVKRGPGHVPMINDGTPLPANAALATGRSGRGKGKVRQYGLRQLKP